MMLSWMNYGYDAAMLTFEAQQVIGLRLAKLSAGGPAAALEATLMVNEKIAAAWEAGATLAAGGSGHKVLKRYRRHVGANYRRLKRRR
ncbi:hypothetical protein SLNSH_05105 [Alsobacter soli]|uniref:Antifreeze protein n=1 Tax=Alsobacter soli TaxID=2109933 RepID=A0A2T1HXG1_9HYPH|nr:hypothetical protein [Alsobacter soli]PSC06179.1 hypothetical protein SLNSH_05105 [Alsobacter soli]